MNTFSTLPRRRFLATATAAAAAPFILPSCVWSADVQPSARTTLGFIGMGKQNRGLLNDFIKRKEAQVVAVCDVDTTRRETAKKTVESFYANRTDSGVSKGCAAYTDFRELLARRDIDAVVIATPDHWHAIIGIAAANAGKDIYCEKPLTQSIAEARALVNATRRNKRVFQVGSMQRSSREFRVACELVRNGVIGKVQTVTVAVGAPGRWCDLPEEAAEPGLDWNLWLGPAPSRAYNSVLSPRGVHDNFPAWRNYREYGGGGVTDWGAHHFDIAQWGLGMDDSGPVEITPAADEKATQGARFTYANGVQMLHGSGFGVTFKGTDGTVEVNRGKFRLERSGKEISAFTGKDSKPSLGEQLAAAEKEFLADAKVRLYNSTDHKGDFLASIRSRKPPICDVEVGARSVTVCHLCNFAYYHHEPMKWDPAKEQFVGGKGRAAWLDVPRRDPWKLPA